MIGFPTREGANTVPVTRRAPALALALCYIAGCSDSGRSGEGGSGVSPADSGARGRSESLRYQPCEAHERVGRFQIRHLQQAIEPREVQEVVGAVRDGVLPGDLWEELATEGDCRVLVGPADACDPACGSSEYCATGSVCTPRPTQQDVGSVHVRGLGAELTLTASSASFYQAPASAMLATPPFEAGAAIDLRAEGGIYEPFSLRGRGVPLLELAADELVVAERELLALRWDAPAAPLPAGVHVELDIAHHGGISARIVCELEDTGNYDVPATLVTTLLEQGVAGFPAISVARRTADSIKLDPGCVELVVVSEVLRPVVIPGVESCSADVPCPNGVDCNPANLLCSQ